MKRKETLFACNSCGYESSRWLGRCPACGLWNTLVEQAAQAIPAAHSSGPTLSCSSLETIGIKESARFSAGSTELDNLLGGGIVPAAAVLLGGEPGIGKSTLLLQAAAHCATQGKRVLYVAAEESLSQIKLRATRIGVGESSLLIVATCRLEQVLSQLQQNRLDLLVVDSIQALASDRLPSPPGALTQVRECTSALVEQCKTRETALFLSGHVTKEGTLAGPKALEHIVDTVLYFEGSRDRELRLLRSVKNRFGSVNEIGVFLMGPQGLQEVHDPAGIFLADNISSGPGSALTAALEGNRVLIAEIQALITEGMSANIARTIDGMEPNRVLRVKAVLDRRLGMQLSDKDVFVNVTGGLSLNEPAVDLAVAAAMAGSFLEKAQEQSAVYLGEISLLGEIRRISQPQKRIVQTKKLGIPAVMLPAANREDCTPISGVDLVFVENLQQAFEILF